MTVQQAESAERAAKAKCHSAAASMQDVKAWVAARAAVAEAKADAADRWEASEASRDVQCDWWVAARSNARCAA